MSCVVPTPSGCIALSRTARYAFGVPAAIVTGAASNLRTILVLPVCLNRPGMYSYASLSDFS